MVACADLFGLSSFYYADHSCEHVYVAIALSSRGKKLVTNADQKTNEKNKTLGFI
jgi:hypothetical protein